MSIGVIPLRFETGVRHVGPDDILSFVAISTATKQLATRDDLLAAKVNEIVGALGDSPPLPLVFPRTSVQAQGTVWLGNFRIPKNYVATVVNATIASDPVASAATFQIVHSAGTYGSSGAGSVTELITTTSEITLDGYYVGEGELLFKVTSSATKRLSVLASAIIVLKSLTGAKGEIVLLPQAASTGVSTLSAAEAAPPTSSTGQQVFSGYGPPSFLPVDVEEAVYTDKISGSLYVFYDGTWH